MKSLVVLIVLAIVFLSCNVEKTHQEIIPSYTKAVAKIHSINGSDVSGIAYFTKVGDGVHVKAQLQGLTGKKHGFHIHTFGDCSADDGTSTGGHFNPRGVEHGAPESLDRHMGAMGNLVVDEHGLGIRDYIDPVIVIEEIIGRGVIIHAGEDDLVTQPSGASGPRIGCGVIGISQ